MHVEEFIDTTLTTRNRSNYQKVVELVHEHQLNYLDNPTYLRAWYYTIRAVTHTEEVARRFYDHLMAAARILKIDLSDEISLGLEHDYITRDQAIAVATTTWHVESMLSELPLTDEELIRNAHLFVSCDSAVVTAFGKRCGCLGALRPASKSLKLHWKSCAQAWIVRSRSSPPPY